VYSHLGERLRAQVDPHGMQQVILRDGAVALRGIGRHALPTLLRGVVYRHLMYRLAYRTEVHVCAEVGAARIVQQLHELMLADRLVEGSTW